VFGWMPGWDPSTSARLWCAECEVSWTGTARCWCCGGKGTEKHLAFANPFEAIFTEETR
jgi:predicted RNA-binding protein with PUA domain